MRRVIVIVARALRDFAYGIHLANGIRHGVPRGPEASGGHAPSRQPGVDRPVPGEQMTPAFTQPFAVPAVASSSRV